jgi:hydrogenase expression/formation protein HypE
MKHDKIIIGHGSGGRLTNNLIKDIFVKYFDNEILDMQGDSSVLTVEGNTLSFTTDSFVVNPVFFPGGNIGNLAIAGTVNDLAVSGAKPLYLSAGFIIEEGLPLDDLETIVKTMAGEAKAAGVKIVTGDTKVVERGKADKIFINTTGIGVLPPSRKHIGSGKNIVAGDKILINGAVGDHGMAVMAKRNELNISSDIKSDCAALNGLIAGVFEVAGEGVKFMRDATRGGLSAVLTEMFEGKDFGVEIEEDAVPVHEAVAGMCELLGFDPFHVANEGKVVIVVDEKSADAVLRAMHRHPLGKEAAVIGEITAEHKGKGHIITAVGGRRIIDMPAGELLPRIC